MCSCQPNGIEKSHYNKAPPSRLYGLVYNWGGGGEEYVTHAHTHPAPPSFRMFSLLDVRISSMLAPHHQRCDDSIARLQRGCRYQDKQYNDDLRCSICGLHCPSTRHRSSHRLTHRTFSPGSRSCICSKGLHLLMGQQSSIDHGSPSHPSSPMATQLSYPTRGTS